MELVPAIITGTAIAVIIWYWFIGGRKLVEAGL